MKRKLWIALALTLLALWCGAAMAEDLCTIEFLPGNGQGEKTSIQHPRDTSYTFPGCPSAFTAPSDVMRFGGWTDRNGGTYYREGQRVTLTSSMSLAAVWYFEEAYQFGGTLDNGMTWEMELRLGNSKGEQVPEDEAKKGNTRLCIYDGWIKIHGAGPMPNFEALHQAPWDAALYKFYGVIKANVYCLPVVHEGNGYSWTGVKPIEVTLDEGITSIGSHCFSSEQSGPAQRVHIPYTVARIERYAFYNNYKLYDVVLPDRLTYIGDYAFANCKQIVATPEESLSSYYASSVHQLPYDGVLVIPDSVTYIGSYAFMNTGVYRVLFPLNLSVISEGVFYSARDLNVAILPDILVSIGDKAFMGCGTEYENFGGYGSTRDGYSFTAVPYAEVPNPRTTQISKGTVHLPAGVRSLGKQSFFSTDVYSLVLNEGLTEVPEECFAQCGKLYEVSLPESLTTIGAGAFNKDYYLGASVTAMAEITIPRSVIAIGDYALGFRGTTRRLDMTVYGYRGTVAETYVAEGNNLEVDSSYSQGSFTFVPLDREDLYLFGIIDGQDYACGTDAENLGDYKFEETDDPDVYTLTVSLPGASYVGVKRDKDDLEGPGLLYYSAADCPGENTTALLSSRGETTDVSHLLRVPGHRKVIFSLARHEDGTFTLSYDAPTDYQICGEFTDWAYIPMTLNSDTGLYEYVTDELSRSTVYAGRYDFYLNLNDIEYGADAENHCIYDTVEHMPVYPQKDRDGNYVYDVDYMYLFVSSGGVYTITFDDSSYTISVSTDTPASAWLQIDEHGSTLMKDPTASTSGLHWGGSEDAPISEVPIYEEDPSYEEDPGYGEEGGPSYGHPSNPWQFPGETTVWAAVHLYEREDGPYTFQIMLNGTGYGENSVIYQEYDGQSSKTVKLIGSDTTRLLAGQAAELLVWPDRSGIYDFYFGMDSHNVMVKRRSVDYTIAYPLSKVYDGERVSFGLPDWISPELELSSVSWYQVVDGEKEEFYDSETDWIDDDLWYYGPFEVGDYQVVVRDQYDGVAVRHPFSITEQGSGHTYDLLWRLGKEYDGEPVVFDPSNRRQLVVDGGQSSWAELEVNGEVRCIWRQCVETDGNDSWTDLEDGAPTNPGHYAMVIQEWDGSDWIDAVVFEFDITGSIPSFILTFDTQGGAPVPEAQTVQSGETATAPEAPAKTLSVFTGWYTDAACAEETLYDFTTPVTADLTLYAGWLLPKPNGTLILPAFLTTIEADAFNGIAAEALEIPESVTAIDGNPFTGSPNLRYIYGYNNDWKEWAETNGYTWVSMN